MNKNPITNESNHVNNQSTICQHVGQTCGQQSINNWSETQSPIGQTNVKNQSNINQKPIKNQSRLSAINQQSIKHRFTTSVENQ